MSQSLIECGSRAGSLYSLNSHVLSTDVSWMSEQGMYRWIPVLDKLENCRCESFF